MENEDQGIVTCIATFCAGSFWDLEAAFRHLNGVVATSVGFMGGWETSPSYEEVCEGETGHSEVVMIAYDPDRISFRELLGVFFNSHDPCRLQQGEYSGTQYEPVIFLHNKQDKQLAEGYIAELRATGRCPEGVVTRTAPASEFYRTSESHQQFYEKMGGYYSVIFNGEPQDN